MSQTISHATLEDRFAANQHDIPSISGLDTALAALSKSDHEIRGYAYDAMHASHSSIHHASVAVAEAAYIESILRRLKDYQSTLDAQQAEITQLITEVEGYMATLDDSVNKAENAQLAAEAASVTAQGYASQATKARDEISGYVSTVTEKVVDAVNAASEAKQAATEMRGIADQAQAIADGIEASAQASQAAAQSAASSAAAAESAAQDAVDSGEAATQTALEVTRLASSATDAATRIVNAASTYVAMAESAEVSAHNAQEAANSAASSALAAAESETGANAAADRAQYILDHMSEAVEGSMHFRGVVERAGCLPPTGDKGDIYFCAEESAFFLYRGDAWTLFSAVQKWSVTGEGLPDDISDIQEGGHVTSLDGEGGDEEIGILRWIGTVDALPAGDESQAGDTVVYNGLVYTFTGTEWSVLTNETDGRAWALYATSITDEEVAAVMEALHDGGSLTVYEQEAMQQP